MWASWSAYDALAEGRLLMPFSHALAMPSPYFLVGAKGAFDKAHCRDFHRWMVARGREQGVASQRLLERDGGQARP